MNSLRIGAPQTASYGYKAKNATAVIPQQAKDSVSFTANISKVRPDQFRSPVKMSKEVKVLTKNLMEKLESLPEFISFKSSDVIDFKHEVVKKQKGFTLFKSKIDKYEIKYSKNQQQTMNLKIIEHYKDGGKSVVALSPRDKALYLNTKIVSKNCPSHDKKIRELTRENIELSDNYSAGQKIYDLLSCFD